MSVICTLPVAQQVWWARDDKDDDLKLSGYRRDFLNNQHDNLKPLLSSI
jgi:hypothetical protein